MKSKCPHCGLIHEQTIDPETATVTCLEAQAVAMAQLLDKIAAPTTCRGCPATIYMVRHKNGAMAPYTVAGLNHFSDCPAASNFTRKPKLAPHSP